MRLVITKKVPKGDRNKKKMIDEIGAEIRKRFDPYIFACKLTDVVQKSREVTVTYEFFKVERKRREED